MNEILNQNIFREYDIRGIAGQDLMPAATARISRAIGTYFRQNGAKRIALGFDCRESSRRICENLTEGLNASGCDVLNVGMVPTPVLYYAVHTGNVDGGVMITGSHNPPDHNGFKICLGKAALFGPQIREIHDLAVTADFVSGSGSVGDLDVFEDYCGDVASRITLGTRPLRVCLDAGNGMGGITAAPIYRRLGIDVKGLFVEPDPCFPNHHPDPTVPENLNDLATAVLDCNADVGIAFDGDGDRIGVVDETGRIVWGDELLALFSRCVLAERPGSTIIGEVKCSQTLFEEIEKYGGKSIMWKAGHSLIKAKMKETGAALAGEMSGHVFFADRWHGFDDATYAGARLMEILSRSEQKLSEMLADMPKRASTPEIRIECSEELKFRVVREIAEEFAGNHEVITIDGARILFESGWGLVRASNTQALLILRFEAETDARLLEIRDEIENSVYAAIRRLETN